MAEGHSAIRKEFHESLTATHTTLLRWSLVFWTGQMVVSGRWAPSAMAAPFGPRNCGQSAPRPITTTQRDAISFGIVTSRMYRRYLLCRQFD